MVESSFSDRQAARGALKALRRPECKVASSLVVPRTITCLLALSSAATALNSGALFDVAGPTMPAVPADLGVVTAWNTAVTRQDYKQQVGAKSAFCCVITAESAQISQGLRAVPVDLSLLFTLLTATYEKTILEPPAPHATVPLMTHSSAATVNRPKLHSLPQRTEITTYGTEKNPLTLIMALSLRFCKKYRHHSTNKPLNSKLVSFLIFYSSPLAKSAPAAPDCANSGTCVRRHSIQIEAID
jgi:hypothetical protein